MRRGSPDTAPRPQIYARCNYCNQSLSLGMIAPSVTGRSSVNRGTAPATKHIVNSCPGCKKPLPRCALCLLSLNCSLPSYDRRTSLAPHAALSSSATATTTTTTPSTTSTPSPYTPYTPSPTALQVNNKVNLPPHNNSSNNNNGGGGSNKGEDGGGESNRSVWAHGSSSFDEWFSWCQTCRHGGHAKHLLDWFSVHAECPVTDCTCKCFSI